MHARVIMGYWVGHAKFAVEKKNDHPIFRPFRFPPLLQGHAALEAEIFGDDIYADSPLQDSDQGVGTGAFPPAARAVVM